MREHILASADVFVTDLSVERLRELGLDWPALGTRRPDLVHAEVSAFGDDNPFQSSRQMAIAVCRKRVW